MAGKLPMGFLFFGQVLLSSLSTSLDRKLDLGSMGQRKQRGQTRLAKYFTEFLTTDERRVLEGEVVRRCLARTDKQNELAMLEFIHCFVEVLDKHFGQVCELDIMNEPEMATMACLQERPLGEVSKRKVTLKKLGQSNVMKERQKEPDEWF
eukprot:471865-Pelagomonas_calceolata.AAC.1